MNLPNVSDLEVVGKRVLVRADLDVPVVRIKGEEGVAEEIRVVDDARIKEIIPTVRLLLDRGCSEVVMIGHLGHEQGEAALTTFAIWGTVGRLTGETTSFWGDAISEGSINPDLKNDGRIHLLENLRKYSGEEENEPSFCQKLASFGDVFVNESFANSHRNHASVVGLPMVMREEGKAVGVGLRFNQEVQMLTKVLKNPKGPLVFIIGGAKIESKLPVISRMEKIADKILVGGRLPSEVSAQGMNFGEKVVVASLSDSGKDIDAESVAKFEEVIEKAGTVVWSGPMGMFEVEGNENGTRSVAKAVSDSSGFKVAGGGDTEAALRKFNLTEKFDWISIGGGAMLEFLATGTLPGIAALLD